MSNAVLQGIVDVSLLRQSFFEQLKYSKANTAYMTELLH